MARSRRRSVATASRQGCLYALSLCAVASAHFTGKFEFPSNDPTTALNFSNVDSVNVSWFVHDDSIATPVLVITSSDPVPQPLFNMSVPSDGSQIIPLNFTTQAISNATFSITNGGTFDDNAFSSGTFNVAMNNTAAPVVWSESNTPSSSSFDTNHDDSGDDDHHHHHDDSNDGSSDFSSTSSSSSLSPTIIALIVLLSVAFVFVVLLLLRFIHVRWKLAAQAFSRKDSETSSSARFSSGHSRVDSWSRSTAATAITPLAPKQQRILGINVGESQLPQRMQSRRWFGHALRNSETADDMAARYGIGRVMPAATCNDHSLALRPAGVPRTMSPSVSSPRNDSASTPTAEQQTPRTATMPSEMPTTAHASTFRGYELPAKQAGVSRSTMASSVDARWSEFTEKTLPVLPSSTYGKEKDIAEESEPREATLPVVKRTSPPPLNIAELEAGGPLSPARSPRKSPGFRATAMSAIRGSGMTVPFALASPRNWKKSSKLMPSEGAPF